MKYSFIYYLDAQANSLMLFLMSAEICKEYSKYEIFLIQLLLVDIKDDTVFQLRQNYNVTNYNFQCC